MEMSILCNFLIANDKDIKNSIPATFFAGFLFLSQFTLNIMGILPISGNFAQ